MHCAPHQGSVLRVHELNLHTTYIMNKREELPKSKIYFFLKTEFFCEHE